MKKLSLLLLTILVSSCASTKKESNIEIADNLKAHRYSNIYFSGQPSEADLNKLKDEGFATVINLRMPKEGKYKASWEKGIVEKNGMNYYNVPYDMKKEITDEKIDQVTNHIMKHRNDGKILVHCSSGNRAAFWAGAHFQKDHQYSKEDSTKMAQDLGLTKEGARKKLQAFLNMK